MKRLALCSATLVGLFCSMSAHAFTFADYEQGKSLGSEVPGMLVATSGQSYLWANAMLQYRQQPQLFCAPGGLRLAGQQYENILVDFVSSRGEDKGQSVNALLLYALVDMFPCDD